MFFSPCFLLHVFPVLASGYRFSRAWLLVHVFPRFLCSVAHLRANVSSVLHVFLGLPSSTCFPPCLLLHVFPRFLLSVTHFAALAFLQKPRTQPILRRILVPVHNTTHHFLQTCESAKRSCSHNFPLYCPPEFQRYNPIQPPWASSTKQQQDTLKR